MDQRVGEIVIENYTIPRNKFLDLDVKTGAFAFVRSSPLVLNTPQVMPAVQTLTLLPFTENLTAKDLHALVRLIALIRKMLAGVSVSNAMLKNALTTAQYVDYLTSLNIQSQISEQLYCDGKPKELTSYNLMVRTADFLFGKYEQMSGLLSIGQRKYKTNVTKYAEEASETAYEKAIEHLDEIITSGLDPLS